MSQTKKYQKIMGLAMGAVLLGTPLVQSSTPVFAETTADTQATTDVDYTADQLNQLIATAQEKVDGATTPTPYLKDGKIPNLKGLADAISAAKSIDTSDNTAIQTEYQNLTDKIAIFDKNYQGDLAAYQDVMKSIDAYNALDGQPSTGVLTKLKGLMDTEISGKMLQDYSNESTTENPTDLVSNAKMVKDDVNIIIPLLQSDSKLQKALTAGQKIIDGGQYTTDQLKDLQKAMDDAKTNVTSQDWSDPVTTMNDYQGVADPATKAINAAIAALPEVPTKPSNPGTTTPVQPVAPTSFAFLGLQKYVAQVAPNVPAKTTPQLTRALAAAQTALAKNGTGYSDNDLNVLNYALNKAYGQYVQTLITPLNAVGQVYTKGQGVTLYNQPAGSPVLTANEKDRTLVDQSAWKVFDEVTLPDGSTWYNVGKNQWVNANYVLLEKDQVVKVTIQNGAKLWQLNQEVFGDTNRTLGYQTDWRSFGDMIVQDQKFYNLGANQWVNAKDVTIEHE